MVGLVLYVEGGGDGKTLRTECRKSFSDFLAKAGLKGTMPRIVASGGRRAAYDDFCTALAQQRPAMLLVDSEDAVTAASSWDHLRDRDGDSWPRPAGAADEACHLMVQCMESWLLCDPDALEAYYGQGFARTKLPKTLADLETIPKATIYRALKEATSACKTKSSYGKGEHSFKTLALIAPEKVVNASTHAAKFIDSLKVRLVGT